MSYSSEFNLKREKCLSCAHYSGCHGIKYGFLGDRIEYEDKGVCSKRGKGTYAEVGAKHWCSRWERDPRISSVIASKEQAAARNSERNDEFNRQAELQRQGRAVEQKKKELEAERYALKKERERLERERYLSSLTPEQRAIEEEKEELFNELVALELEDDLTIGQLKSKKERIERNLRRWRPLYFLSFGIVLSIGFGFLSAVCWLLEELGSAISLTFLLAIVLASIIALIAIRRVWKKEAAQLDAKIKEAKGRSMSGVFPEAVCYDQMHNAIGYFIEGLHKKGEVFSEKHESDLVEAIKAYFKPRVGNPIVGAEDMACFIQLLVRNGKMSEEEGTLLLKYLLQSKPLEVAHQSEAMGRLIEQTKAKIKKDNLTPEQCQKMFEDEKGVLKSCLLMRAVFELQQEGK